MKEGNVNTPSEEKTLLVVHGCSRLNVREKANKSADVLCIVNAGDSLEVVSGWKSTNPWVRVAIKDDVVGFVMKEFVKEK